MAELKLLMIAVIAAATNVAAGAARVAGNGGGPNH